MSTLGQPSIVVLLVKTTSSMSSRPTGFEVPRAGVFWLGSLPAAFKGQAARTLRGKETGALTSGARRAAVGM
jgi:hypothetical protein